MLQQRQQRNRRQFLRHRLDQQAEEHRRRRIGELLAGAVVSHHTVAQQFGRHAACQVAIRCHQGRPCPRRFQRVAQHQGDGGGFLLLVGRGKQRHAVDRRRCRIAPLDQFAGRQHGAAQGRAAGRYHGVG